MELRDAIRPLRKWWWLVVSAVLVAGVSSFLATRQQAPIFSTRATVMVGNVIENPNPSGYEFYLNQQLASTYADIATRDNVRQATMAALGLPFLPEYRAKVVANTQLIELTVTDTDPARAQQVAAELVNQLSRLSPTGPGGMDTERQAFINGQLNVLEEKIAETQAEVEAKQDELANMFSARQIADAQTQISALQTKQLTLQANYASLLSNTSQGAVNTINVVEAAVLPTKPVGPNKLATILLAIAIGLILSGGAAYLMEYLDDTLKNPDDVQRVLGLSTLGAVPLLARRGSQLPALASSQSIGTEAYRVLRTNLQFAAVERPLRTLLITSPAPSEGKSVTIANLAVALAQAGRSVVVVDGDLHRPRQHRLFNLPNNAGLTTALLQEKPMLAGLLQPGPVPGLRVLTSGPLPPNPAELMGSAAMRELLSMLAEEASLVLLDSPPVVSLSDAAVLASQTDGVLLVLDARATRRELARRAVSALQQVNARIIGVLLNRMPKGGAGDYYYYYYHYGYDYGQDTSGRRNGKTGGERRGLFRRGSGATQQKQAQPSREGR